MGITKREIASELGVSKRTVANYIEKLGLGNHVSRNGNTDFLDDFAAAAIADALKNPGKPSRQPADAPAAPAPDSLVDSLAAQLEIERSRNAELMEALAAERDRAALAKRRRTAMATAAAAAAQQRVAAAAVDQTDTRAELLVQLDEQIAALDLKIRQLQSGGTAKMLSGPLLKAAELGAERKKLADERNRLAGGGPAPRRPEPPRPEQNRPRGPRH